MKDAISVHVVYRLEHLVHVVLDALLWQVVPPAFDCLVHVHVHQLEHQRQAPRRLVTAPNAIMLANACFFRHLKRKYEYYAGQWRQLHQPHHRQEQLTRGLRGA